MSIDNVARGLAAKAQSSTDKLTPTIGIPLSNWAQGNDGSTPLDETSAIQAAIDYASANGFVLRGEAGKTYWATQLTLKDGLRLYAPKSTFKAMPAQSAPFIVGAAGRLRFLDIDTTLLGVGTTSQMGVYLDARKGVYGDGGLWDSKISLRISGFDGHGFWLRGGNKRYLGASSYDYLTPHQFNYFNLDIERPVGNVNGCCLVMTGQCGQSTFSRQCRFDGMKAGSAITGTNVTGLNIYIGREVQSGTGTGLPGTPYDPANDTVVGAFSGTVWDDNAPNSVWLTQTTSQSAARALWVDRGVVVVDQCYFEDNQKVVKVSNSGKVFISGTRFGNCGYNGSGGGYFAEVGATCSIDGERNYTVISTAPDAFFVMPSGGVADAPWIDRMFPNQDSGLSTFSSGFTGEFSAATTVNVRSYKTVFLHGSATPPTVTTITSGLCLGDTLTVKVHDNLAAFASGGNLTVPNNRVVLRAGDTITFRRHDRRSGDLVCIGIAKAELRATAQPTSGFYEAGEFVRNTTAFGAGTVTLGWQRLTTGTAHVAGTDWRAVNVTAV